MTDATTLLNSIMRYLVKAKVKEGKHGALLRAIDNETLGRGSIAGDEYRYNMEQARVAPDGTARWVETCFCDPPLAEERPYWEKYFELSERERRALSPQLPARERDGSRGPAVIAIARASWKRNCRTEDEAVSAEAAILAC